MRCPDCGHNNPNNRNTCQICHTTLMSPATADRWPVGSAPITQSTRADAGNSPAARRAPWTSAPSAYPDGMSTPQPYTVATSSVAARSPISQAAETRRRADVTGRVIAMDAPILERPDFDVCRFFTKTLWLILLVVSPLIFLHAVLVTLGAVPALLAVVGLLFLVRFLSPTNLFTLYHLMVLINPLGRRNEGEQVPVRYLRVRGEDGESEHVIRMKGALTLGNVMPDDIVSFWGRWRRGVLHARYAFSHRTQAWIELQRSYTWVALAVTVCVVVVLIAYFYGPVSQLFVRAHEWGIAQ